MIATLLAAALSAQTPATAPEIESADAGFVQLSDGKALAAVRHLETLRADAPEDPALLINLAAAYIEVGQLEDAREAYVAAIRSGERARLEMADGSWVDSRNLARTGLARLESSRAWAMK